MCGVVGYQTATPSRVLAQAFTALCEASLIRGLHACGVAWWDVGQRLHGRKWHDTAAALRELPLLLSRARAAVWHNRYSTSGDWHDHANNQPLHGEVHALAFNGVLDMRTRTEIEQAYGVTLQADNDGYLFLQALERGEDPVATLARLRGTFAGLWLDTSGQVWALRNRERPLWWFVHAGTPFAVSTADMAQRALGVTAWPLPPNRCLSLPGWGTLEEWPRGSY